MLTTTHQLEAIAARQRRLDLAIVHVPGDWVEETLVKDHWVREKLRGNCNEEIEVDVIPGEEELPVSFTFEGKVGIGGGRFIQVDAPVTFYLFEHKVLGVKVATYTAGVGDE